MRAFTAAARILLFTLACFGARPADAQQAVNLSGRVTDGSNPVAGALVEVLALPGGTPLGGATSDATGSYSLSFPAATYDVRVTPPAGSMFTVVTLANQTLLTNTTLDIVLVSAVAVTLSGRVLDAAGQALSGQSVQLVPAGGGSGVNTITDTLGGYSVSVTSGSYRVNVSGSNPLVTAAIPGFYSLNMVTAIDLTSSTVFDLMLPAQRVDVRVQDPAGTPVPNVGLAVPMGFTCNLSVTSPFGPLNACASSGYSYTPAGAGPPGTPPLPAFGVATNTGGDATLWLFAPIPPLPAATYTLTAIPPAGSPFGTTNVSGVAVNGSTAVAITLSTSMIVSGRVLDALGQALSGQSVRLVPDGGGAGFNASTDALGAYRLDVIPGNYHVNVSGSNPLAASAIPSFYGLNIQTSIDLTASTVFDIMLPAQRVQVRVQDPAGTPVADVGLAVPMAVSCGVVVASPFGPLSACASSGYSFTPAGTGPPGIPPLPASGLATNAAGDATLWLFAPTAPPGATYTLTAIPPAGSPFGTTNANGVVVTGPTSVTITLSASMIVSGRVLDALGQALSGQSVRLVPDGGGAGFNASTDALGAYRLGVIPGNYHVSVSGSNPLAASAIPGFYGLNIQTSIDLTASTVFDIMLPAQRVQVRVQDPAGTPVADVGLAVAMAVSCGVVVASPFGPLSACASSGYSFTPAGVGPPGVTAFPASGVATNAAGNATLWLFGPPLAPPPAPPAAIYTLTAIPPAGGPFGTFNINGVEVQGPKDVLIVLQFVHAPPQSTLVALDTPAPDGRFADPAHFALSATATAGHAVASIHYSIDGGADQPYLTSFSVSGSGSHTIRYWAVDDAGVFEIAQLYTFEIRAVVADTTPPSVTPQVSGLAGLGGWYVGDVTIAWTVTDGESAVTSTAGCGTMVVHIDTAGTTLTCTAESQGGSASASVTVKRDATPPAITAAVSPAANAAGWNNTNVIARYDASDSLSGLAHPPAGTFTFTPEGSGQSHVFSVSDAAGNVSTALVGAINIDKTAPEAYLSFDLYSFDIVLFGRDALSGVPAGPIRPAKVAPTTWPGEIDADVSPNLAALLLTYNVTDAAGNMTRLKAVVQPHQDNEDDDAGLHATRGFLMDWRYGAGLLIAAPTNRVRFEWRNNAKGLFSRLNESVRVAQDQRVTATWTRNTGTTEITIAVPGPETTVTRPGISLLRLATVKGGLRVEYDIP